MNRLCLNALAGLTLTVLSSHSFAEQYLFDLATQAPYKKAYEQMLAYPGWITKAQGVSTPMQTIEAQGKRYTVGIMCEPHNCGNHQMAVAFSADGKQSWGLLANRASADEDFNKQWLGEPDTAVQQLLNNAFADNNPQD